MDRLGSSKKEVGKKSVKEVRVAGISSHNEIEEMMLEPVRPAKGFGRWIYCKYCYKNVKPMLSGINQLVCSKCGCGLTPDFFLMENLKRWLKGDESALDEDRESEASKAWVKKTEKIERKPWKIVRRRR